MGSRTRTILILAAMFLGLQAVGVIAQNGGSAKRVAKKIRRARPPKFDKKEISKVFFDDIFAALVGKRPANLGSSAPTVVAAPTPGGGAAPAADGKWASIISSATIEDEVKALKLVIDKDVTTPGDFKGRGYEKCRVHFSTLAMLFAVAGEYDGDVRWKKDAPGVRDVFARTAANAKVGTNQVYNEAKLRKQELQDLVGGGGFQGNQGEVKPDWGKVVDRSPLMKRLEMSMQERLQPSIASASQYKQNADKVLHELELFHAISVVLTKEGLEDADDDDYKAFAQQMKKACKEAIDGVKMNEYEQVRKAIGAINTACDACHELYRQ